MENKVAEEITKEFFEKRFPEKDIEFEKKVGYFYEWVNRFKSGEPELSMDRDSLRIWKEMQEGDKMPMTFEQEKEKLVKEIVGVYTLETLFELARETILKCWEENPLIFEKLKKERWGNNKNG